VRSHHEAQAARRVAGLLGRRPGTVVREEAVALLALLTSDPDAARRFAEKELGALMEPTDAMARLRATLRVYTEESSSPARTSRRLGVHQNTVVYRVNRAEEILGRPLAERRLEIEVALRLADALPGAGPASGVAGGPGAAERP
jgi:DNA-binding PucR family transcriptional regulator